jgi:monomeric isocitrate dehydrogenase
MYWAEALAAQDKEPSKKRFYPIATELLANEASINTELIGSRPTSTY